MMMMMSNYLKREPFFPFPLPIPSTTVTQKKRDIQISTARKIFTRSSTLVTAPTTPIHIMFKHD